MYTVGIQTFVGQDGERQIVGRFSDETWDKLWRVLGVDASRWKEWSEAVQSASKDLPVVPEYPEISRLAYIDEGSVRFSAAKLGEESIRLLQLLEDKDLRTLIEGLQRAAETVLQNPDNDAAIVVHRSALDVHLC